MLDTETKQLINSARRLGGKGLPINLTDGELLRLCAVVAIDVGQEAQVRDIATPEEVGQGYYALPLSWFARPLINAPPLGEMILRLKDSIPDFLTYFKSLCAIHKRRLKFRQILEHQALPQMEQIVPRSLLEFGLIESEAPASWLVWRKWLYDVDNRAAQETGYLFEPILAAALGGVPYAASTSPIRRLDDPNKGRQVDCIEGMMAYEFKMRVTIAASGQGRFQEELAFARDCQASGYTPILLVLDPTSSPRLQVLSEEYQKYGGETYIGAEAWRYIEAKAGETMGRFVAKYVRVPLTEVEASYHQLLPLRLVESESRIVIEIGGQQIVVDRLGPQYELTDEPIEDGQTE